MSVTSEKRIKSNEARLHFHAVLDDAEKGVFTGIGRWNDPPTVWVVSDKWYELAKACLTEPGGVRQRKATEALRHFRAVLDDAKDGVFTGIGRWNDPPTVWVVSDEWYQRAKECLAKLPTPSR